MPSRTFIGTAALVALTTVACSDGVPTSPASNDVSPLFSRGEASRNLGELTATGWTCMPIPTLGVHCFPPGAFASSASLPVRVFDSEDATDANAPFLGTELLIRDDLYAGQPCVAQGGEYGLWPASESPFPVDYRYCHRFAQ